MKSSSVFFALPVVAVGLILAFSMGPWVPESWLWILILGLGLSGLLAVSTGFSLSFTSTGTNGARPRRFYPGLLPANNDPVAPGSSSTDPHPETECTVWDGF
jgi:hypothetical protein